ncbi:MULTISPECIES: recombinase family protein [Clostridium]|uniref:recombinase family protein n=1 Tax=Clostridium TaxID=1485 RepID=UPI000825038B|nr:MULTISPECIES: recombinase family protein [Clostridium]PJI10124.1 recombinase family protein [Clostridium sp. CT7]
MRVAIYSRKSKFTGKGESIGNQVELCKNYCTVNLKHKNITDFLIYEDEGFSGKNTHRPNFQKMLKAAKAKKFDILICYRLDRISRNIADFSTLIRKLVEWEIDFISIREQFDTNTPMGRAMMYIASVFAQLERETIAERVKDNMIELAKMGRWLGGQTPLGFKSQKILYLNDEFKQKSMYKLSPINTELKKVKLIYNKYIETNSIALTLKYLLSNNIKGKNGGNFAAMSINDVLRNPVYVKSNKSVFIYLKNKGMQVCGTPNQNGILIYNKKRCQSKTNNMAKWIAAVSNHSGIIEADTWLYVQEILDKNSKKLNPRQGTSKKSLLSGILKCAECGAPMRVSYGRPKKDGGERIYYYTCTMKAHSGKSKCSNPNVRGDKLEKVILENLKKLDKKAILKELQLYKKNTASTSTSTVSCLKHELKLKNKEMNALLDELSNSASQNASKFILLKIDSLGKEISNIKSRLKNLNSTENTNKRLNSDLLMNCLNSFKDTFDVLQTIEDKRNIINALVRRIEWNGTNNTAYIYLWGSESTLSQYNKSRSCLAIRCK